MDDLDKLKDSIASAIVVVPWLTLLPLFFLCPSASEPVGDNSCTHWDDCIKQSKSLRSFSGPDKEANKDSTTPEQK